MKNKILIVVLIICPVFLIHGQDSLSVGIEELKTRIEKIEGFQENTRDALDNKFDSLSNNLEDDYDLMKKLLIIGVPLSLILLITSIVQGKKYVDKKLKQKFDNLIDEHESGILKIINKHNIENQILENKKILVLTSKEGDDAFLKKFFKEMGFTRDNVKYIKTNTYGTHHGSFDAIFANNDKDDLDFNLINEYFNNSNEKSVLFYYNTTRKQYSNDNVSNRLSFANTRTQIYGNLINLLKYQAILD